MALTKWRRPHSIRLPGGYVVAVVYWSPRQISRAMSATSKDQVDPQTLLGYWDVACRRVVINKAEPIWVQITTLGHELIHAINDYNHWLKQTVADPMMQEAGTLMEDGDE